MTEDIKKMLGLPEEAESILITSLKKLSEDDGQGNSIEIENEWMAQRFVEAGLSDADKILNKDYPVKVNEYVVHSSEMAISMDSIAVSYAATRRRNDVFKINEMPSSVDALDIKGKQWYFIEFKNGDWKPKDIKIKVYESIILLSNLYELDKNAIIKNNRDSLVKEIENLGISKKLGKFMDEDTVPKQCQNNGTLIVVYSDKNHIARLYKELCSFKKNYADMNQILAQMKLQCLEREKAPDTLDFGYPYINKLAGMILSATSVNRKFEYYNAIIKMLKRMIGKDEKNVEQTIRILDENPLLVIYLWNQFYGDNPKMNTYRQQLYKSIPLTGESLMKLAARGSMEGCLRDNEAGFADHYEVIQRILNRKRYKDEKKQLEELVDFCKDLLHQESDADILKEDSFFDIKSLLKNDENEEICKRGLFLDRVFCPRGRGNHISVESYCQLLKNIAGIDEKTAKELAKRCEGDAGRFYQCVALWQYLYGKADIRQNAKSDYYVKICCQMDLLNDLAENKDKIRYGRFQGAIKDAVSRYKGEEKEREIQKEVQKIVKSIEQGKTVREIMPLYVSAELMVDANAVSVRRLQTLMEGIVLKKVEGCRGVDFEKKMEYIERSYT